MKITLGQVTLDDGRAGPVGSPAFPHRPAVHVFDCYRHARGFAIMAGWHPIDPFGGVFKARDGTEHRAFFTTDDPEGHALRGSEASAYIVHTPALPPRYREILAWRASRARVDVTYDYEDPPRKP